MIEILKLELIANEYIDLRNLKIINIRKFLNVLYREVDDFDEFMVALKTIKIKGKILLDIILKQEQKFYFKIVSLKMYPEIINKIYNYEVLNDNKLRKKYIDDNFVDDFISHLLD